jgi:ribonuclease J
VFVIDPYTALVLHELKGISAHIPQFDWGSNIRVFFVQNSYTRRMASNRSLFRFKSAKITYGELQDTRDRLVIKDSYAIRSIFSAKRHLDNTALIYSMWEGYLREVKAFWDRNHVPVLPVHCSGHAYIADLKQFAEAIKPKHIIPIHTFFPQKYSELFGDCVEFVKDGQTVEV